MKRRPWPIVIIALLYFFAPIGNILMSAAWMGWDLNRYILYILENKSFAQLASSFLLLPLAGVAIYAVKKWSYFIFLAVMSVVVFYNYVEWKLYPEKFNFQVFFGIVIFNIGLVSYFLLPAVKKVYFNRRIRWWESKPRYAVKLPAKVKSGNQNMATIIDNISEGGALLVQEGELSMEEEHSLQFSSLGKVHEFPFRTVYRGKGCYGVRFKRDRPRRKELSYLIRGLKAAGYKERSGAAPWTVSFKEWAAGLLRGKGLTPDLSQIPADVLSPKKKS